MNRLLVTILVSLVSLLCVTSNPQVKSDSLTPEIAVTPIQTLGLTDSWNVVVTYPSNNLSLSKEEFYINGTESDLVVPLIESKVLNTVVYKTGTNEVVNQDILLGFSCSWKYTLEIWGKKFNILAFDLGIGFPVRMTLQCTKPMIENASYPVYATLTPLDWPDFNEFNCTFSFLGSPLLDFSQSLTTPIGPEKPWTPFILPIWFWNGINFVGFSLDVGLKVAPKLFSDRIEAKINVLGDASLESRNLLVWNAPNQRQQFYVKAENISSLDYARIILSQFKFFLNRMLLDFNLALQFNWIWGSSNEVDFPLFTIDASNLLPTLTFGIHPQSPAATIEIDVPITKQEPTQWTWTDKNVYNVGEDITIFSCNLASFSLEYGQQWIEIWKDSSWVTVYHPLRTMTIVRIDSSQILTGTWDQKGSEENPVLGPFHQMQSGIYRVVWQPAYLDTLQPYKNFTCAFAIIGSGNIVQVTIDNGHQHSVDEPINVTVGMNPNVFCFCFSHEWRLYVFDTEGSHVSMLSWTAQVGEEGYREKSLIWVPSEKAEYVFLAELVGHGSFGADLEVIPEFQESVILAAFIISTILVIFLKKDFRQKNLNKQIRSRTCE